MIEALSQTVATLAPAPAPPGGAEVLAWGPHALAAGAVVGGLTLWLFGGRILRPMFVFLCAVAGGLAGALLAPETLLGAEVPPAAALVTGMVLGAAAGFGLYRFATGAGFGMVLACAAVLGSAAALGVVEEDVTGAKQSVASAEVGADPERAREGEEVEAGESGKGSGTARKGEELLSGTLKVEDGADGKELARAAGRSGMAFARAVREELSARWGALPEGHRRVMALCGAAGGLLGVLIGLALPRWAAAGVTAPAGSAAWLAGAVWLLTAAGPPWREHVDRGAGDWLVIWGIVSAVGVLVQWSGLARGGGRGKAGGEGGGG